MRFNLKKAREDKEFEVKDMSMKLEISESFYYKIERGTRNPSIELANKISNILDKTVEELFFDNKET